MDFITFSELCDKAFAVNGMQLPTDEQKQKLYDLTEIMLQTNKSMNLTAIKEESEIIVRHYVDSLLVSGFIPSGSRIIDVGCGAGFPTLPLAIFRPDISILALDSTAKRINYVASTAKTLELLNVTAIAARAEDLANNCEYREKFDVVTARAVAALPVLSELCIPFVKKGGTFVAMKATKTDSEIDESRNAIKLCGGKLLDVSLFELESLSKEKLQRTVVRVNKLSATPQNYPRQFSKISKKPL